MENITATPEVMPFSYEAELSHMIMSDNPHQAVGAQLMAKYLYGSNSLNPRPDIITAVNTSVFTTPGLTQDYISEYATEEIGPAHRLAGAISLVFLRHTLNRANCQSSALNVVASASEQGPF